MAENMFLLCCAFSDDSIRHSPEKFHMLKLIPFFHEIRIRARLYNNDLFYGVYINPLSIDADCHKLAFLPFRHPPLVSVSDCVVRVVVCARF